MDIEEQLAQIKKARRSVRPDDMHALLSEADDERGDEDGDDGR